MPVPFIIFCDDMSSVRDSAPLLDDVEPADGEPDAEPEFDFDAARERLPRLLDRLEPLERDLLELYVISGSRVRQDGLALLIGMSQAAISYRLQRAVRRLKFMVSLPELDEAEVRRLLAPLVGQRLLGKLDRRVLIVERDVEMYSDFLFTRHPLLTLARMYGLSQTAGTNVCTRMTAVLGRLAEVAPEYADVARVGQAMLDNLGILKSNASGWRRRKIVDPYA